MLKQQGYRTAMVGKWHLGFEENGYDQPLPGGPVDVGFDSFFGIRASTDIPPYFYIRDNQAVQPPTEPIADNNSPGWSPIQGAFWRAGRIAANMQLENVLPRFTEEAISVIEQHATAKASRESEQPLFLYLAYPAPHTPWLPSPEFAGRSQVGMYGDFAEMVDSMIGRVLATLDRTGMSEDTLLVFTSDNGPVWYEADVERFQHDSSGGLRGMKADAWEAGHRLPFIVRWPNIVAAGSTSQQTICFTDIMATLASISGYPLSSDDAPDSFDFSAVLRGTAEADAHARPSLVMRSGGGLMTIREGDWKLIDGLGSGGFSEPRKVKPQPGGPTVQLYNLKQDLAESIDLSSQRPEIVARLKQQMEAIELAGRHR
jgi:arylsulfatase A